ncbi:MAG: hypothetical protein ACRDPA_16630, partial [Solirubrobacteraceae bacterium]
PTRTTRRTQPRRPLPGTHLTQDQGLNGYFGTVFESKVKDAGMTTSRKFELTAFEAPTKIRWAERSKNLITVPDGGYDLEKVTDTQTRVTIRNTFEAHGFGKVIVGFATRAAVKDAPAFAQRIKSAVEAA